MALESFSSAIISLALLVVLTASVVWLTWRGWSRERARRARQLDAVHNARMRRERGD